MATELELAECYKGYLTDNSHGTIWYYKTYLINMFHNTIWYYLGMTKAL